MAARTTATAKTPVKTTVAKKTTAAPRKVVVRSKSGSASVVDLATEQTAYVPDKSKAERYVHREVFGVPDFTMLRNARANNRHVLLMGDTGSGKTMLGEAFAAEEEINYCSIPCDVSIDPTALFGKMMPTDTVGKFEWQDGPVTQIVRTGGVLNISEGNMMPPKIAASLFPLLDGRGYIALLGHKGEIVRAHPDLLVIMDMNPNYRGTMELNAAYKNRFAIKVHWGYDENVESSLVSSPTIREIASQIRALVGVEIQTPVSTNALMEFESFANDTTLGLDFAIANFVANFGDQERDSISKILELNRAALAKDLAFASGDASDDEFEEFEGTYEIGG